MIRTDARSMWRWSGSTLSDERVSHFWDDQRIVGRWFAEHENSGDADAGIIWDAYYLYGPAAQWEAQPGPLIASGGPVREKFDVLYQKLVPLLSDH